MTVPWAGSFDMEQTLCRQLVSRAKAGDAAAFERIVALNERTVLRVARRLLASSEEAKDAAQEVFIRLHRGLARFDETKDLAPWLYRVTVNICRDFKRRTKVDIPLESAAQTAANSRTPEQSVMLSEQYEMVLDALAALSQREREAIVLRDLEGCPTSEVASMLGSSETTVRSQLSTGRMKIKKLLADRMWRRA
ncbi:MAG: sigma-70 family RNA polymerase sigma factor [Acidobacteriaceae bacterium]|nr:sigma-70 family RNA polymerase sigma factor [Acidobacteriaceae bacterium]MBV9501712.1 sigma-70 family RNA polymerase sigma factor [Acidobacteriaceae bacterium]